MASEEFWQQLWKKLVLFLLFWKYTLHSMLEHLEKMKNPNFCKTISLDTNVTQLMECFSLLLGLFLKHSKRTIPFIALSLSKERNYVNINQKSPDVKHFCLSLN